MIRCPGDCTQDREERMIIIESHHYTGQPLVWCDPCIAGIITALNYCGHRTVASCCGHKQRPGRITFADGREIILPRNAEDVKMIEALFRTDVNGESR